MLIRPEGNACFLVSRGYDVAIILSSNECKIEQFLEKNRFGFDTLGQGGRGAIADTGKSNVGAF